MFYIQLVSSGQTEIKYFSFKVLLSFNLHFLNFNVLLSKNTNLNLKNFQVSST